MPAVNQMYSVLNDINAQMFGAEAIDVHDLSGLISMGKQVLSTSDNTELFFNKLIDRIGRTVVRTLDLELDFPELFRDEYEFGCILQKITINPFTARPNSSWAVTEGGFTPTLLDGDVADIVVTYFTDFDSWSFQAKLPSNQIMMTAFTDETTMGAFMAGITESMTDSMTISLNNMARTAINNFIAEKILANNGIIKPMELWNDTHIGSEIYEADTALYNKEFVRFLIMTVSKYIKYMSQASVLYNCGVDDGNGGTKQIVRATARDNMHVLFLTEAITSIRALLESDTWNREFLDMPLYKEVGFWQGDYSATGTNTFDEVSTINVIPSSQKDEDDPSEVEQSGIICALIDRQAVAVGLNKRRNAAFYNPIDDYTVVKSEASLQYINDLTENGVIFVLEDIEEPEP